MLVKFLLHLVLYYDQDHNYHTLFIKTNLLTTRHRHSIIHSYWSNWTINIKINIEFIDRKILIFDLRCWKNKFDIWKFLRYVMSLKFIQPTFSEKENDKYEIIPTKDKTSLSYPTSPRPCKKIN